MNPYMQTQAQEVVEMVTSSEAISTDKELLAQWGFTAEEITSLLWLRQCTRRAAVIAQP